MEILSAFPVLEETADILRLAEEYRKALHLPQPKALDASHLAAASWHGVDYLLTWNCKHIASVQVRRALLTVNLRLGLPIPGLCTPEELEA
jgi:predicted nucleic acid-binding protein